jgi:Ni,Fe-hydrogenase maturation factor
MSYREIYICVEKIGARRHRDIVLKASFHGIKIPSLTKDQVVEKLSPEKQAAADKAMEEALQRRGMKPMRK